MSVTAAGLCGCVGEHRGVALSLHYERMTTNEEICRAILHLTSANHEPVTHANVHTARETWPFMLWHSGERGIEMRSKKETERERKRERDAKATEEQISGLKERQRKRGVTKKKRSGRVKWKDRGGDGLERREVETAASSIRLPHSSYLSVRQQAGGRVDRQKTKTTLIPAASCWCQS